MRRSWLIVFVMLFAVRVAGAEPALLVMGDSLSAAYGISEEHSWVALLKDRLRRERLDYKVVNASISGETTSGGAARIQELLARTKPAVTVLWLGANDGLRGLPVRQLRENLEAMLRAAAQAKSRTLLVGVRVPPNYGMRYAQELESAYRELASAYRTALAPFPLQAFAARREMFQPDAIHPTAEAQPLILDQLWTKLAPLLRP